MGYTTTITGFVTITTAIFGFTQYYYSRILDKDSNLSNIIEENLSKLGVFQLNSIEMQSSDRYQHYFKKSERSKTQLDDYALLIKSDLKKATLLVILHILIPIYIVYLVLYGFTIYTGTLDEDAVSIIPQKIIPYSLYLIACVLSLLITVIYFIVRTINSCQRTIKTELVRVSHELSDVVHEMNVFKAAFKKEEEEKRLLKEQQEAAAEKGHVSSRKEEEKWAKVQDLLHQKNFSEEDVVLLRKTISSSLSEYSWAT